jgi:outer membrane receptor for ferrienterochelin and colicins
MKKSGLLVLILGLSLSLFAGEKTDAMLFGDVKSKVTGEHIPYANIIVKGTNMGTAADGTGHFKLANLPVGKCIIIAHAIGYKSQEKEVVMERGKAVNLFFDLDEDVLEMEQVVITGTRTKHYVKDVPVRTEVITIAEIENKNALSLYEALENMPGIRVENQCQYCNFTMVRMQGLGAEHTQILINGQPTYSGLAGVYGLQQIGTADIDRIEVVKGAGSALYGSSAVAGAINIVTKEPSYEPSTTVGMQFGKYNTNKYDISASMRNENGNIGLSIFAQKLTGNPIDETGAGTTREEIGNPDGISDRVASDLTNAGFNLYINNAFFSNDKLVARGKSIYEKRQGGTMDDDYYCNPLTDGTESITTSRYESEINYTKPVGTDSELNFSLAYAKHNRDATNDSYLGDYMATHGDSVPDLRDMRPYLAEENSHTSTLTFLKQVKTHSLLLGAQVYYDDLEESGMYVVVDNESDYLGESYRSTSNKSAREFGAFIQDEWAVTPSLTIVPGVRVDKHHSSEEYTANKQVFATTSFPKASFDETSVNPRLAVKYALSEKVALRANVGTGFRAPYGFSEDLHLCSGSPRVWKSSDLNPETSVSYNFSADYYGDKMRVSGNLFRTDLKDKIGFINAEDDVAALGYDYQWENIDDAFVQGFELSIGAMLIRDLELGIDFTYNQGEYDNPREDWIGTEYEKDSKYISRFPTTTGNLQLEYHPRTWNFSVTANYQGSMYIDYYNEEIDESVGELSKIKNTDPFILVNARVLKRLSHFKLYAGVDNIFDYVQDEKYLDDAAFMYAPMFGTMVYCGLVFDIN